MNTKTFEHIDLDYLAGRKWWYIHKRWRTPFYTYMLWEGLSKHYNQDILFPYECHRLISLDNELAFDQEDWDGNQVAVTKEFEKDPGFIMDMFNKAYALNTSILAIVKKINSLDANTFSNKELADHLNRYFLEQIKSSAFMAFPMVMEKYLDDSITKVVKTAFPADSEQVIHILTTCLKPSEVQNEEMGILKLAIKKRNGENIDEDIDKHIGEYGWLKNSAMNGQFYTKIDVISKIEAVISNNPEETLHKIENDRSELSKSLSRYKSELSKFDPRMPNLIDTLQEAIYFRSWRTERFYRNVQFLQDFFKVIAGRIGLKDDLDIFYLTPREVIDCLLSDNKAQYSIIDERKLGFIALSNGKETTFYSGPIVEEAKKKISLKETKQNISEFTGRCAYPGKISGNVVIVKSPADFKKMISGSILVAPSTTPDYVPVIKMASVIITDEGGVLSHASVISRELKIPCVIGTKIATQVLKDGDKVEVDATQGKISLIK